MMQPGGGYLYGNGNGNGSGLRYGRGQPYRPPVPPEQQMTPQEREAVLLAAGRLAAEHLVNRGDLPPNVLENRRPPAPIPPPGVGGPQPAFGSQQYHQQPPVSPGPRAFHFQGRPPPPAPQHRQPHARPHPSLHFQGQQRPPAPQRRFAGPRPFQGGRGPFPKRPRQRPFPYGPPGGPAPPQTRHAGQAATPLVSASENEQDDGNEHSAPAGEAGDSQPTAQPDAPASGTQRTNGPSSRSLGANASESS